MTFKITFNRSVDEHKWEKDDKIVTIVTITKRPSWLFTRMPNIPEIGEDFGFDIEILNYDEFYGDAGGSADFVFSDNMKAREKNKFIKIFEEEGLGGLEESGWEEGDRITIVKGGYDIEEVS